MRVKMLRSLGKNLPALDKEDDADAVKEITEHCQDYLEGQVRDMDDGAANWLIRNKLAEETDEDLSELPRKAEAVKGKAAKGKQQKFPAGARVEVTDKALPQHKQQGEVESAAPVSGSGDPFMYTVRRDDGTTFKASEGQLKKA